MIIIPDIHGRTFWKGALRNRETEDIVFLGDYVDPYDYEGITTEQAIANLEEILAFKHEHPDNVTLLLGNHDLGYLCPSINMCRHSDEYEDEIERLFTDHLQDFVLCTSRQIQGKTYLFSHAMLNSYWLKLCQQYLHFDYSHPKEIASLLNQMFSTQQEKMYLLLSVVSRYRGGEFPFGSIVWSDIDETQIPNAIVQGTYNVFGHTQLQRHLIYPDFACLDCRRAFTIDAKGKIKEIEPPSSSKDEG